MDRLAILQDDADEINQHLTAASPREEGAFCLLWEGKGQHGRRLLASRPFLSCPENWERQGSDILRPTAQWLSAAVSRAIEARAGLLFIHSHPNPYHPPGLSITDHHAFEALARTLAPMLDGPFAAAVAHPRGWSCVVWSDEKPLNVDQVISVGRTIRFFTMSPERSMSDLDLRQRDALGIIHDYLRSLTIAVVGVGGLGSPVAEQLVRMGIAELILIDPDVLDTPSNVRRMFGTKVSDVKDSRAKVDVLGEYLESLGFGVPIRKVRGDIRFEEIFRHLLDADAVILATHDHSSRATANELPSAYLLPVVDAGVRVGSKSNGDLSGLLAEVRILTPTTPCLWCRRTINADTIRVENLPKEERQRLVREGYVTNTIVTPAPTVAPLTVLASGMATCALLGLLAVEGDVASAGYWFDGLLGDSSTTKPDKPIPDCRCRKRLGQGDHAPLPFMKLRGRDAP